MAAQVQQQPTIASSAPATTTLPGIVTDQPEIFESMPSPSEISNVDQIVSDIVEGDQLIEGAFDLNEVPIKDAFSFFAEREQEIAQFFFQRYGEYKINSENPDQETDIERYYRLVSETTELLNKFKSSKTDHLHDIDSSKLTLKNNDKIVDNLEQLSSQLKLLELEANNGSLNQNQYELDKLKARLTSFSVPTVDASSNDKTTSSDDLKTNQDLSQTLKLNALAKKVAKIETLIGHNEDYERSIRDRTKCDSLYEATDKLVFWMQQFLPSNFDKVDKELDYLTRKLDLMKEKQDSSLESGSKLDSQTLKSLNKLCEMVTSTDKYRAMVPEIISRLTLMDSSLQKNSQVVSTVNYLEQMQSKIQMGLEDNTEQLKKLNSVFAENIENMKSVSADIDRRISRIKENEIE